MVRILSLMVEEYLSSFSTYGDGERWGVVSGERLCGVYSVAIVRGTRVIPTPVLLTLDLRA